MPPSGATAGMRHPEGHRQEAPQGWSARTGEVTLHRPLRRPGRLRAADRLEARAVPTAPARPTSSTPAGRCDLLRDLFERRDPDFGGALFTLHVGDRLAAAHFALRGASSPALLVHRPRPRLRAATRRACCCSRTSCAGWTSTAFASWTSARATTASSAAGQRHPRGRPRLRRPRLAGDPGARRPYGVRRAAERLPLGRVSALPGKAMRRLDLLARPCDAC